MTNSLAKFASVMIACNDPAVLRRIFERIAITNPDVLMIAGAELGLITDTMHVAGIIGFPVDYIDTKVYDEVKILVESGNPVGAIKHVRASVANCGLKAAKDFVVFYFPDAVPSWRN